MKAESIDLGESLMMAIAECEPSNIKQCVDKWDQDNKDGLHELFMTALHAHGDTLAEVFAHPTGHPNLAEKINRNIYRLRIELKPDYARDLNRRPIPRDMSSPNGNGLLQFG